MRVFLYEYMSAQGPGLGGNRSLDAEGWAMLSAVVEDFVRIAGVSTMTLLDDAGDRELGHCCRRIGPGQEASVFRELSAQADFTLVIAPEFQDLLATRSRWVLEANGRLLGSSPEAVTLAGDKLELARHFQGRGVPTPPGIVVPESPAAWNEFPGPEPGWLPAVCKPRHGAGSQATFLVRTRDDLMDVLASARAEMGRGELILQPFVPGLPASVAFLLGPGGVVPLLPAAQHLSSDGRFHYQGGEVPLPADLSERALGLGRRAVQAIPGLHGYAGVDVVLGDAVDGSQDYVIEVNPRLTTSYIGLRQLACGNLAAALLATAAGQLPALAWKSLRLRFWVDGTMEIRGAGS